MHDVDIPMSGEPYIKKSKLLALAQEHLFEPLSRLFGKKQEEADGGEVTALDTPNTDDLDLEQHWEILEKAFNEGQIDEEQYTKAREQYIIAKCDQSMEVLAKAFDSGEISEEEYLRATEKSKAIYPLGSVKDFGGRPYIKTKEGWKYHSKKKKEGEKEEEEGSGDPLHDKWLAHVKKLEKDRGGKLTIGEKAALYSALRGKSAK